MTGRYYLTSPIFYVNDVPHIGHAYTSLACDIIARFKRLEGNRVHALTGTDEHGQKIEQAAKQRNTDPKSLTDTVSENFRQLAGLLNLSFDDFIRTTEPRHHRAVIAFWQQLVDRDMVYLGSYQGWYSIRDESFFVESELSKGEDGQYLAPTGANVEWLEEPSYFFRLSAMQDELLALYRDHPDFIAPEARRNEVISFVRGGLHDLSVSRSTVSWGVPVPGNPDHVIYVWVDALINYLSALGYPDTESDLFREFWPCDLHVVGKDIIRFHAVYWPAMLLAAGLPLPTRVFAHGWWTNEGQKMSKSLGNVIHPSELVERYGLDAVRYFLMRDLPFGRDGDFQHLAMIRRINGDLANDYGNLAQRVLSMTARYHDGLAPEFPKTENSEDSELLAMCRELPGNVIRLMDQQAFHLALEAIWRLIGVANRYVDRCAPWQLVKTNPGRCYEVLAVLLESLRVIGTLTQPFIPETAGKLLDQLAVPEDRRNLADLAEPVPAQRHLPKPTGLFPRFQDDHASG